jgi:hypothetical protein
MKPRKLLVPEVSTYAALHTCISKHFTAFAIKNPLYAAVLPTMDGPDFLPGYSLELHTEKKILIAKRKRFPNRFSPSRHLLIYPPLGWE